MLARTSFARALRSAGQVRYGSAITMKDGAINVPNDPIIPFIEGECAVALQLTLRSHSSLFVFFLPKCRFWPRIFPLNARSFARVSARVRAPPTWHLILAAP
jgi:hypothetical protein